MGTRLRVQNKGVRAGGFLHVLAWVSAPGNKRPKEFPFRWMMIRRTSEPIVINLPEDTVK